MDNNKDNLNEGLPASLGPWWKPGVQILSEVSTWIVTPIVLALIAGKALDTHFGTKPLWLLVFVGAAFLVTVYGITKTIRNYNKQIQPPKSPLSGGLQQSSSLDKGRSKEGLNQK